MLVWDYLLWSVDIDLRNLGVKGAKVKVILFKGTHDDTGEIVM